MATAAGPTPMFPLGTVLFPGMPLPLHVFEPRYQALMRVCLDGEVKFGVVLIERGSEVGGGDERADVATMTRLVEVTEFADGRFQVHCVGTHRVRIDRWYDDDPYPRAEVRPWPDEPGADADELDEALAGAWDRLHRVDLLRSDRGLPPVALVIDVAEDAASASYQLSAALPVGPFDRQSLLAAPDVATRVDRARLLLDAMLADLDGRTDAG